MATEFIGILQTEYITGNDIIHELTKNGDHKLKIVLTDFSNVTKFAEYRMFLVDDETYGYRLSVIGYAGTAGTVYIVTQVFFFFFFFFCFLFKLGIC